MTLLRSPLHVYCWSLPPPRPPPPPPFPRWAFSTWFVEVIGFGWAHYLQRRLHILHQLTQIFAIFAYMHFRATVKACIVLFPLLGITWLFGLLSITSDSVVPQYVFAVLNSIQASTCIVVIYRLQGAYLKYKHRSLISYFYGPCKKDVQRTRMNRDYEVNKAFLIFESFSRDCLLDDPYTLWAADLNNHYERNVHLYDELNYPRWIIRVN